MWSNHLLDSLPVSGFYFLLLRMVTSTMAGKPSIVLIDDIEEKLEELQHAVGGYIGEDEVVIKVWRPVDGEDPLEQFRSIVDQNTVLVVTDYDLTKGGLTGLFGASIVSWCQA